MRRHPPAPQEPISDRQLTRPVYREPGGASAMLVLGAICVVAAIVGFASSPALGAVAAIAAIFYFSLSGAFVLLAKNSYYAELTAWHLQELRGDLSRRHESDRAVSPKKSPAPDIAEPYRL